MRATENMPSTSHEVQLTVGIVIPTYNHARYLAAAIESVLAQTRPADEVIVVDDGSEDEPGLVVARFAGVRFSRRDNGGLSAARNTGLEASSADRIIFLDADDVLHPRAIEQGLAAFAAAPDAVFAYGAHRRVAADGSVLDAYRYDPIGSDAYSEFLVSNKIGMHATVMYDRRALVDIGGFDATLRRCEDYDVYLRLSQRGPVVSHEAVVADYRWHGDNMSSDSLDMLDWVLRVHARQRAVAARTPGTARAWRLGRSVWRTYYAELTLEDLGGSAARPADKAWRALGAFKAAPVASTRKLLGKTRRRLYERAPAAVHKPLRLLLGRPWPPRVGAVKLGDLGTTAPISEDFGFDRGTPIDRYYIENFLARQAVHIRGRVLEVGDAAYSQRFGGQRILQQDVLHISADAPGATIVGDLAQPGVLPEAAFDCIVLTQTLHLLYDMRAALAQLARALKPRGVLLLTVPGISQLDRGEWGKTWSWSLTEYSARRLLSEVFEPARVDVRAFGNVFAATAMLQGLAQEEVDVQQLDVVDPAYPVIITAVAFSSVERRCHD